VRASDVLLLGELSDVREALVAGPFACISKKHCSRHALTRAGGVEGCKVSRRTQRLESLRQPCHQLARACQQFAAAPVFTEFGRPPGESRARGQSLLPNSSSGHEIRNLNDNQGGVCVCVCVCVKFY